MAKRDNHVVNAMRATAAILVVISHVRNLFFRDYSQVHHSPVTAAFYAVASLGHGAVMVFFALSGFWVGGSVLRQFQRDAFGWREYALRRGVRLWIVLLPALLLTGVVDHIGVSALAHRSVYAGNPGYYDLPTDLHAHLGAGTLVGNAAFLQAIRTTTYGTNGALWSLAYEFWFYLLFPLLLLLATRRAWWHRAAAAALGLGICFLIGSTVIEYFVAWLAGTVIAAGEPRIAAVIRGRGPTTMMLARLTAAAATFAALLVDKAHQAYSTDLLVAGCSAVLLATLVTDVEWGGVHGWLLRRVSAYAHSSYSLYAIHLPLAAMFSAIVLPNITDRWNPSGTSLLAGLGVVGVLMAAGWAFAQGTEARTDAVRAWLSVRIPSGQLRRSPASARI